MILGMQPISEKLLSATCLSLVAFSTLYVYALIVNNFSSVLLLTNVFHDLA